MSHPVQIDLIDNLGYPCFFLDSDFKLRHANPFAKSHASYLCTENELGRRICNNNVAKNNLINRLTANILLYDAPVSFRSLFIIPTESGYIASLSAPAFTPQYPAGFAEQLRHPLTEIFATLPLLSQHLLDPVDDMHLQRVNKSCYSLLRDANILTSLSRLSNGVIADLQPIDLNSLVSTICHSFHDVALPEMPIVHCHVSEEPLAVLGDCELLGGILENLLSNSLRFTRDGNEIDVTLRRVGRQALLTVRDRGCGIRPEILPYVFDTYYSAPIWPENPAPGLGLGLPYIYSLTSILKGTVTLESLWGEGTVVSIALPLDKSDQPPLKSNVADYVTNRYSSLYIELHEFCRLPQL